MASQNMLHILGPRRWDAVAAIVGDRAALEGLRRVLNEALETGSGGAVAATSDGEPYLLAVALQPDMQKVHTTYADEADPVRSLREQIPIRHVAGFIAACAKAGGLHTGAPQRPPLAASARPAGTKVLPASAQEGPAP